MTGLILFFPSFSITPSSRCDVAPFPTARWPCARMLATSRPCPHSEVVRPPATGDAALAPVVAGGEAASAPTWFFLFSSGRPSLPRNPTRRPALSHGQWTFSSSLEAGGPLRIPCGRQPSSSSPAAGGGEAACRPCGYLPGAPSWPGAAKSTRHPRARPSHHLRCQNTSPLSSLRWVATSAAGCRRGPDLHPPVPRRYGLRADLIFIFLFLLACGPWCQGHGKNTETVPNTSRDLRSTMELRVSAVLELFFQSWSSSKHTIRIHMSILRVTRPG
jgi:hypothetical protein